MNGPSGVSADTFRKLIVSFLFVFHFFFFFLKSGMNGMLSSFTNGSKQEVSFISLEWNSMETNLNLFTGLFRSCANACMLVILTVSFFLLLRFSRVCMSYCTLNRRRHYPGDGNSCRHRQFRCPTWWQFK